MLTTDEVAYQAETYRLVAQLLRFPDAELGVCVGELGELFCEGSQERSLLKRMGRGLQPGAEMLRALEVDHTSLFIGAFKMLAPPYASYYLDGKRQLGGPTTAAVERTYRAYGLALASAPKRPGDHLATLLEFLFELLRRSLKCDDPSLVDVARDFFQRYVQGWVGTFGAAVAANARAGFYVRAGELLPLVLVADSLLIDEGAARPVALPSN